MMKEATVMAMVPPHPNVLTLIGCVTSGLPKMLLVPVCELGSMLSFIEKSARGPPENQLGSLDKIVMAHDVANGMAHLISCHFVHRDLAARNVLVNSMYGRSFSDIKPQQFPRFALSSTS